MNLMNRFSKVLVCLTVLFNLNIAFAENLKCTNSQHSLLVEITTDDNQAELVVHKDSRPSNGTNAISPSLNLHSETALLFKDLDGRYKGQNQNRFFEVLILKDAGQSRLVLSYNAKTNCVITKNSPCDLSYGSYWPTSLVCL